MITPYLLLAFDERNGNLLLIALSSGNMILVKSFPGSAAWIRITNYSRRTSENFIILIYTKIALLIVA